MKIRCLVAFAVLLVLTVSFGVYLALGSNPTLKPGLYLTVKPTTLEQTPDLSEYITLNYTHKSELDEYDLVRTLDNFNQTKKKVEEDYKKGLISEQEYQNFLEYGDTGRVTDKVKKLLTSKTKYILWQPDNQWFIITSGIIVDTDALLNEVKTSFATILSTIVHLRKPFSVVIECRMHD